MSNSRPFIVILLAVAMLFLLNSGAPIMASQCSYSLYHAGLTTSDYPELKQLGRYEAVCGGGFGDRISTFAATPSDKAQATDMAAQMTDKLKAFRVAGLRPLIFLEPVDENGIVLDQADYSSGVYDKVLHTYFDKLQSSGLNEAQLGTWVLMPEGNLDEWHDNYPTTYAANVTWTAKIIRQYFPAADLSIMLDSQTYGRGYVSLLPYVRNIPAGLITSFGLQGFPWPAPNGQSLLDPNSYLRTDFAEQAARQLGVKRIWLNTGTFGATRQGQTVNSTQRRQMLADTIRLAAKLRADGYHSSIHLFAEDKFAGPEGIDWAYLHDQQSRQVFAGFVAAARASGTDVWLFDE